MHAGGPDSSETESNPSFPMLSIETYQRWRLLVTCILTNVTYFTKDRGVIINMTLVNWYLEVQFVFKVLGVEFVNTDVTILSTTAVSEIRVHR